MSDLRLSGTGLQWFRIDNTEKSERLLGMQTFLTTHYAPFISSDIQTRNDISVEVPYGSCQPEFKTLPRVYSH